MPVVRSRVDHPINHAIELDAHLLPARTVRQYQAALIGGGVAQRVGAAAVAVLPNEFDPIAHLDNPAVEHNFENRLVEDGRGVRRSAAVD